MLNFAPRCASTNRPGGKSTKNAPQIHRQARQAGQEGREGEKFRGRESESEIDEMNEEVAVLVDQRTEIPKNVRVGELEDDEKLQTLGENEKQLIDMIRMICYLGETRLAMVLMKKWNDMRQGELSHGFSGRSRHHPGTRQGHPQGANSGLDQKLRRCRRRRTHRGAQPERS